MNVRKHAACVIFLCVLLASLGSALPIPAEPFLGSGRALVYDYTSVGAVCSADFVLMVRGLQAVLEFSPNCEVEYILVPWPAHWALHPVLYHLSGNWNEGFSGFGSPYFAFSQLHIGPYEDGVGIPVTGVTDAGAFAYEFWGEVNVLAI